MMHFMRRQDCTRAYPPHRIAAGKQLYRWYQIVQLEKAEHRGAFPTWKDESVD
jgi:hypothetical protein